MQRIMLRGKIHRATVTPVSYTHLALVKLLAKTMEEEHGKVKMEPC